LSKKKKIIISVIAAVLVLVTILGVVGAVISRQNEIKKAQEEYEQAQNANNNQDTNDPADTTSPDTDIPPVIVPDDTGDETVKDDIILDVTDKDRDPNPGVKDATIEYGTKEGNENAE
jgi:flagellar basal body-associated protein FliL